MAKISLKNFRKYETLSPLPLNDINIFVGKNNAGKSTVVKAIMLVLDNLRSLRWTNMPEETGLQTLGKAPVPYFRFDANDFHNLHIGTFERAKCNYIDDQRIGFRLEYQGIEFTFIVAGVVGEGQVALPIESIKIDFKYDPEHHPRKKGCYEFNFAKQEMTFSLTGWGNAEVADSMHMQVFATRIKELETQLKAALEEEDVISIANIQSQLKSTKDKRNRLAHSHIDDQPLADEKFALSYHQDGSGRNPLVQYILSFNRLKQAKNEKSTNKTKGIIKEDKAKRAVLANYSDVIEAAARKLESVLGSINVDYIQAHAATQKLILSAEERQDINSRTIHEFYQEHINVGSKAQMFLDKWLKAFEIGDGIQIKSLDGEGYYVKVNTGTGWVHLADMGMGSIQLVILILRLATIASRIASSGQPWWVIIEEPEQNIHPMLQSRLAELFKEFRKEFSSTLIIETHSEYLVRNTQKMAADMQFKDAEDLSQGWPFSVYYFPSELGKQPYDMKYQPDGRFAESFGEGFYDEAGILAMSLPDKNESIQAPKFNWDNM